MHSCIWDIGLVNLFLHLLFLSAAEERGEEAWPLLLPTLAGFLEADEVIRPMEVSLVINGVKSFLRKI
jgi:hypothetical protein